MAEYERRNRSCALNNGSKNNSRLSSALIRGSHNRRAVAASNSERSFRHSSTSSEVPETDRATRKNNHLRTCFTERLLQSSAGQHALLSTAGSSVSSSFSGRVSHRLSSETRLSTLHSSSSITIHEHFEHRSLTELPDSASIERAPVQSHARPRKTLAIRSPTIGLGLLSNMLTMNTHNSRVELLLSSSAAARGSQN